MLDRSGENSKDEHIPFIYYMYVTVVLVLLLSCIVSYCMIHDISTYKYSMQYTV